MKPTFSSTAPPVNTIEPPPLADEVKGVDIAGDDTDINTTGKGTKSLKVKKDKVTIPKRTGVNF